MKHKIKVGELKLWTRGLHPRAALCTCLMRTVCSIQTVLHRQSSLIQLNTVLHRPFTLKSMRSFFFLKIAEMVWDCEKKRSADEICQQELKNALRHDRALSVENRVEKDSFRTLGKNMQGYALHTRSKSGTIKQYPS